MTACFSSSRLSFFKADSVQRIDFKSGDCYENPFSREEELREKYARLIELDHMLSLVQEGEIAVVHAIDKESLEQKEYIQR